MASDLRSNVIEVLPGTIAEGMSATAISKAVGYSKLSARVAAVLDELVEAGEVTIGEHDRGYDIYFITATSSRAVAADTVDDGDVDGGEEEEDYIDPRENTDRMEDYILPSNDYGYVFKETTRGFTVVCPDGNALKLTKTERLLVINQDPGYRFVITLPEEVLEAIHVYTTEKGIGTYLVTDMATGRAIKDVEEIDAKQVGLFITISRHNKAGK